MKRKLFILVVLLSAYYTCILAVSAYPYPINIIQPDGSKITILLKGDEHFNYTQTTDGFIIKRNTKGVYEYVVINTSDDIKLSGVKANNKTERNAKEIQYIQELQKEKILEKLLLNQNITFSKQQSIQDASFMNTTNSTSLIGTRKILCILIGFQDRPFTKTQTEFNNLMSQVGYNAGSAIGSVKDFYLENSYGQLNLEITVVGPYMADNNMDYYGANSGDIQGNDIRPKDLIIEAVQKANPVVNYVDFDNNNDGYVDGVHVIYGGYAEAAGAPAETIWPHKWTIPDLSLDGKKISTYSCSSELRYSWGNNISGIGTICHELGHVLGASDFYDTNNTGGEFEGTGRWDLMAQGSWNGDEDIPAHHNPYSKTQIFNWATAQSLTSYNTLIYLGSANSNSNSFYKINTTTSGEYFLVENRQQLGFDSALPGHGMMVYHVHSQIESNGQAINTTFPQKFYPVCASASQNPNSNPISYGEINSYGCPFPGSSNKVAFASNTIPSAISWGGTATGKDIHFITEVGNDITFVVNPNISGPSEICSQSTYTISNLPTGATVAWTYSSNLESVQTENGSITLRPISGGWGSINATLSIGSSQFALTPKTVWVGPQLTLTGVPSVNYLGTGSWTAIVNCGIPPYFFEWYLRKDGSGANALCVAMGDGDLTLRLVQAGSAKSAMSIKDSIILNQPATYTLFYLYARVTDGNGIHYQTSEQRIHAHGNVDLVPDYLQKSNVENQTTEIDESESIAVFPNPTSEYITVEIYEKDFETVNENIDIIVFDKYMNKIKVLKTKSRETSINISDCKAGIYFVQVKMSNKQWMKKVIKQ